MVQLSLLAEKYVLTILVQIRMSGWLPVNPHPFPLPVMFLFALVFCLLFLDTQGTESGAAGARDAPVQFEADPAEADPFGLDAFLKDAKSSKKK